MLSPAQLKAREGKLTASRVACLMKGDAEAIMQLYLEMIGEATEPDLSEVWPVRLGEATEALNLEWVERSGLTLSREGEVVVHPTINWAACTLDAFCEELQAPVEAKHVGGREPLEVVIERYQPQMQWQMFILGASQCVLSVIMGANPPLIEFIPFDDDYAGEIFRRGAQFMEFVKRREPPVVLDPVPAPIIADKSIDMTGRNDWANSAVQWLETREAADRCKDAEKTLKSYVPNDCKKAWGHGVQITRNRAGHLSLREQKDV